MKTYSGFIMKLESNQIYVFGSNTEGRHGKGSAALALKYFNAKYGQSKGPQGQCYALCTKDLTKSVHPSVSKEDIIAQIKDLYWYADQISPFSDFMVAYTLSTNLNSYTPQEMANMFAQAGPIPENIVFNEDFAKLIDTSLWTAHDQTLLDDLNEEAFD
jgi:hypothetical protein